MADTSQFGLDALTGEQLEARIAQQKKGIKDASLDTIVHRWFNGQMVTEKQMEYLRNKRLVDVTQIKATIVNQPVIDKKTKAVIGTKPVRKYYNLAQVRVDNAITASTLIDDASVMSNNLNLAENRAELETKMFGIHHARGELSASLAVSNARKAASIKAQMEVRKVKHLSLKEIYDNAVKAQKLTAADAAEVAEEVKAATPVAPTTPPTA